MCPQASLPPKEVLMSNLFPTGFVPASWKEMDTAIAAEHSRLGDGKLGHAAGKQVKIAAQAQP